MGAQRRCRLSSPCRSRVHSRGCATARSMRTEDCGPRLTNGARPNREDEARLHVRSGCDSSGLPGETSGCGKFFTYRSQCLTRNFCLFSSKPQNNCCASRSIRLSSTHQVQQRQRLILLVAVHHYSLFVRLLRQCNINYHRRLCH